VRKSIDSRRQHAEQRVRDPARVVTRASAYGMDELFQKQRVALTTVDEVAGFVGRKIRPNDVPDEDERIIIGEWSQRDLAGIRTFEPARTIAGTVRRDKENRCG